MSSTTNAKARIAETRPAHNDARAAVLAGGVRRPGPRRTDDGSRPAAPADRPLLVLDEFGPLFGWLTELQQQRRDTEQELKHFDAAEASGYHLGGASRPELVARVEAAKAAVAGQVVKILAVMRRGADASRRRGGREFLYIASQLDKEVATVEKCPAASSSALWHLHRIESRVLPGLREDLRKAEFNAVSAVPVDEEWREGAWFCSKSNGRLDPDTLSLAARRGTLMSKKTGCRRKYSVASVCDRHPDCTTMLMAAVEKESDRLDPTRPDK